MFCRPFPIREPIGAKDPPARQSCDRLVGYGPEGFVVMRGNCYWAHRANGTNAMPPMIPYNFKKKKRDMHGTILRVMC